MFPNHNLAPPPPHWDPCAGLTDGPENPCVDLMALGFNRQTTRGWKNGYDLLQMLFLLWYANVMAMSKLQILTHTH